MGGIASKNFADDKNILNFMHDVRFIQFTLYNEVHLMCNCIYLKKICS